MIAAMLLGGLLVWIAIAAGAGWAAFRWRGRRWLQVSVTVLVLWLPFWDVLPGYLLYRQAVREVGGVRIYQTVEAEGYLDLTDTDCDSCWNRLREPGLKFLEVRRTWRSGLLSTMERGEGYYRYRLLDFNAEECTPFNSLANAEQLRQIYLLTGKCVESTFSLTPVSRYEFSSGFRNYPSMLRWRPVTVQWQKVRDTHSMTILADSARVQFTSWIGRQIELPMWRYVVEPDGRPIELRVKEILVSS